MRIRLYLKNSVGCASYPWYRQAVIENIIAVPSFFSHNPIWQFNYWMLYLPLYWLLEFACFILSAQIICLNVFSLIKIIISPTRPLAQSNPALVIFDSGPVISRCLSCISGLWNNPFKFLQLWRFWLCWFQKLHLGLWKSWISAGNFEQSAVVGVCADPECGFWFAVCLACWQSLVGDDCQVIDFYANGYFVRRCKCNMEVCLWLQGPWYGSNW